jgi:DNA-binding NarL/FixJ family response regulator
MSEIKLLIVEDEAIIAQDIAELCTRLGYEVVEIAHTAGQALTALQSHEIDMVLLDVNLEDELDGIEIAQYIVENKKLPFIYLTSYADMETISRAKQTNPMGYIVKPFNKEQLLSTIEISLHNSSKIQVPQGINVEAINKSITLPLTEREIAILTHIFNGKTNKQMAELEYISVNTIKYYIKQLYTKLDAHSRSSLLAKLRQMSTP